MNYKERSGCINNTVCMRVKEKFRKKFKRNGVYPLEKQVVSISNFLYTFKLFQFINHRAEASINLGVK